MGAVYKSICYEADTLLLLATRLAEKEIHLKVEIEKLMNDGFVHIAKARYIMGSTCVTKMQLPSGNSNPIKALVTVFRKEVDSSWNFYIARETCPRNTKSKEEVIEEDGECLIGDQPSDITTTTTTNSKTSISCLSRSEAAFKHLLHNDPKSLKKSKNAFLVQDDLYQEYNDELLDEMSNSDSNESLVSIIDPIRLFGILVPNVLKEAQVIFNDVVDLLGDCATVQLKLKETLDKFNHLAKVKSLIEAASKETRLDILTPRVYWTPPESTSVSCYSFKTKEEGEAESELSSTSVQKTIRSVFYDETAQREESTLSLWGSGRSEELNDD